MVTEAALSQTEATYYNICTTLLDLQEQLNQAENALSLLLADVPHVSPADVWPTNSSRRIYR